jgi:hypothetical protein
MIVYTNPQRQWLAGAEQELAQRLQEQANLAARIAQLEQTIAALKSVIGNEQEREDVSLPRLCLQVLTFSRGNFQSVPSIRAGLKAIGVEVPGQNPLAVLHTALSRLVGNGLADSRPVKPGAPLRYRITTAGQRALQKR